MQSFLTVFIAGILAFIGVFMMNPETESPIELYADTVSMDVVNELPTVPSVIVDPVPPLVLALDAYQHFDGGTYLPADVLIAFDE
ncbi:MAG: hypothetical protein AAFN91_09185 [Pseudomonadota bacterium]